jgi:hypothetical protein
MLSAYLPWIIAAVVLVVLPVSLRVLDAGREPRNEITHEQGEDRDPGPSAVPVAA